MSTEFPFPITVLDVMGEVGDDRILIESDASGMVDWLDDSDGVKFCWEKDGDDSLGASSDRSIEQFGEVKFSGDATDFEIDGSCRFGIITSYKGLEADYNLSSSPCLPADDQDGDLDNDRRL